MSRPIPVSDQAEIDRNYAVEPVVILKIEWSGGTKYYASKKFGNADGSTAANALGTLMKIENFSEQIKVGNSGKINDISVDLAGSRSYYDSDIIYNTKCTVNQYFIKDGALTTGIEMFVGKIASPITWNESSDILRFDIISQVPSGEYGFSLDEDGSYGYTPDDDAFNVPWPIVFGKCLNVPAVKIQSGISGKLLEPLYRMTTTVEIENGDKFAQTPTSLRLLMRGIVVLGTMSGNEFTLVESNLARYTSLAIASVPGGDDDEDNYAVIWIDDNVDVQGTYLYNSAQQQYNYCYRQETVAATTKCWCRNSWGLFVNGLWEDQRPTTITETAGAIRDDWNISSLNYIHGYTVPADSPVVLINTNGTLHTDSTVIYVASLTAVTGIYDVKAYRTVDKEKTLCNVPSSYYTKTDEDVGAGYNSTIITMDKLLSTRENEGWSDELFVSINSGLSSNTPTLLKWLIDTYTNLSTDASSFGISALDNFPSNFTLFDQGDTMKICEEIAWQARCSLKIIDDTVYLMYLSLEPSAEEIINDDDFEIKTTHLSLTDETEIITKFIANWKSSYSPDDKIQTYVKRENTSTYGLIKQDFNFYIYNVKEWVEKSATFWAHRYANIWKQTVFDSFLNNIGLEATDAVDLQTTLHNIVSGTTKCIIQNISIEQQNGLVRLELWLPVIAGTQAADADAWMTDGESLIDVDVSNLREYNYPVDLIPSAQGGGAISSSDNAEKKQNAVPRSIEGWSVLATILEEPTVADHIHCLIADIDATDWSIQRVPDYVVGEPVKHEGGLYVSRTNHNPGIGNEPGVGGAWTTDWWDLDDVEVQYTQADQSLDLRFMEPAIVMNMQIGVSFFDGIWIINDQPHPETLMGRTMQFKCTTDASAQKFISAKLTQFDHAATWGAGTYYQRHRFVVHTSRLFECKLPHDSEAVIRQPINGVGWTAYWTEWTINNIYFEIKGVTNLEDLSTPLVTGDLITAKYDLYNSQWNAVDTLYAGGGSLTYGIVIQSLMYADPAGEPVDGYDFYLVLLEGSILNSKTSIGYNHSATTFTKVDIHLNVSINDNVWCSGPNITAGWYTVSAVTVDEITVDDIISTDDTEEAIVIVVSDVIGVSISEQIATESGDYASVDLRFTNRWYLVGDVIPLKLDGSDYKIIANLSPVGDETECSLRWNEDEKRIMAVYR